MHVDCLFAMVKDSRDGDICRTCNIAFSGPMSLHVTLKLWRRHRVKAMTDTMRLDTELAMGTALQVELNDDSRPLTMKYLRRRVDDTTALLGPESNFTRLAVNGLAYFLMKCGQGVEAEALLRFYVKEPIEDNDNDWTRSRAHATTLTAYFGTLRSLGRLTEAEAIIRGGIRALTNASDRSCAPYLIALKQSLASALQGQGKLVEAHECLTVAQSDAERLVGPHHPLTIAATRELARLTQKLHERN